MIIASRRAHIIQKLTSLKLNNSKEDSAKIISPNNVKLAEDVLF